MPSALAPSLVAPAWSSVPPWSQTFGPEVGDLARMANFGPDPEQQLALDAIFAFGRDGKSAARDVGIVAPRQNLKTGLLKQCALGWLYVLELRLIVWSAHEFGTAQESFRDMCQLIESCPDLDAEVAKVHRGNGDEAIELKGDRRLKFKARTKSGGRGLTGDRVVLDEAMLLKAEMMGALVPTLRAVRDPQLIFAGSAGLLESEQWRAIRDRGRAGGDPSLAYLEWGDLRAWECADPDCSHIFGRAVGCGLDDEERWWATNTALSSGRITVDTLRSDRRLLPPAKFAVETLGWWEDPPTDVAEVDDTLANWTACGDMDAVPMDPVALGVDVSADSRGAAIVACGLDAGGLPVLEVVEYRSRAGTSWVGPRLAEIRAKHSPMAVGVVKGSPAESLRLPDVELLPSTVATGACMALARDVQDGRVRHRLQTSLGIAVDRAVRARVGDVWRWSRTQSTADISPLMAGVVARHLRLTTEPEDDYDPLDNFMPNL